MESGGREERLTKAGNPPYSLVTALERSCLCWVENVEGWEKMRQSGILAVDCVRPVGKFLSSALPTVQSLETMFNQRLQAISSPESSAGGGQLLQYLNENQLRRWIEVPIYFHTWPNPSRLPAKHRSAYLNKTGERHNPDSAFVACLV